MTVKKRIHLSSFSATHIHTKTGTKYEVLDESVAVKLPVVEAGDWQENCILYRNEAGYLFVRSSGSFERGFRPMFEEERYSKP